MLVWAASPPKPTTNSSPCCSLSVLTFEIGIRHPNRRDRIRPTHVARCGGVDPAHQRHQAEAPESALTPRRQTSAPQRPAAASAQQAPSKARAVRRARVRASAGTVTANATGTRKVQDQAQPLRVDGHRPAPGGVESLEQVDHLLHADQPEGGGGQHQPEAVDHDPAQHQGGDKGQGVRKDSGSPRRLTAIPITTSPGQRQTAARSGTRAR